MYRFHMAYFYIYTNFIRQPMIMMSSEFVINDHNCHVSPQTVRYMDTTTELLRGESLYVPLQLEPAPIHIYRCWLTQKKQHL